MSLNTAPRIYAGNTVRLVDDVYKTETVGSIVFDEVLSFRCIREGQYGTWTITLPNGTRYRNEGRIYLHN